MELRQLHYFREVVETGSLSAAALKLHISQPPLSVAIAKLETSLGVGLLVRSAKGVEPTAVGWYLYEASSRLFDDVDEITKKIARYRDGLEGANILMGAVPLLMARRIPALLREFARQHPDIEVMCSQPTHMAAVDLLERRKIDVAAVLIPDYQAIVHRYRDLEVLDWGPVPLVAVLPPEEASAPDPFPVENLNGRVIATPPPLPGLFSHPELVAAYLHECGVDSTISRPTESFMDSIPLIQAGLACGILPDPDRSTLDQSVLTVRRLEPEPEPMRALILSRREENRDPALRSFIATIEQMRSA